MANDPRPSEALYRKCPACYGTRKTRVPLTLTGPGFVKDVPFLHECPLCEDGYVPAGATLADLRELLEDRDGLLLALADASQGTAEEAHQAAIDALEGRLGEVDRLRDRLTARRPSDGDEPG